MLPNSLRDLWLCLGPFDCDHSSWRIGSMGALRARSAPETAPILLTVPYACAGAWGIDVLAQDVAHAPGVTRRERGFCFPPPVIVCPILHHWRECRAYALIVVPNIVASWYALKLSAQRDRHCLAARGEFGICKCVYPPKEYRPFAFRDSS